MQICFLKDHPSGIPAGTVANYDAPTGVRIIDQGLAREATESDLQKWEETKKVFKKKREAEAKRIAEENLKAVKAREAELTERRKNKVSVSAEDALTSALNKIKTLEKENGELKEALKKAAVLTKDSPKEVKTPKK